MSGGSGDARSLPSEESMSARKRARAHCLSVLNSTTITCCQSEALIQWAQSLRGKGIVLPHYRLSAAAASIRSVSPHAKSRGSWLPHLSRAWTVLQRLELLAAGESVLDTLPTGVVFLMAGGRAIYWNRAADEI